MTMRNHYVVEVNSAPHEEPTLVVERVAEALKLTPEKAAVLVARMPGVITKPLPEERALRVVLRLQSVGLAAVHRRAKAAADAAAAPSPDRPDAAAAPSPDRPDAGHPDAGHPDAGGVHAAGPRPDDPVAEGPPLDPLELRDPLDPSTYSVRNPTGYDLIPSLDATRIDERVVPELDERDPKLTPMSDAGFGAADVVVPVEEAKRGAAGTPQIVDSGSLSRPARPEPLLPLPEARPEEQGKTDADEAPADADPTMVLPPHAEPPPAPEPEPRYVRHTPAPSSAGRNGAGARAAGTVEDHEPEADEAEAPRPSLRLRDAIARDRGGRERDEAGREGRDPKPPPRGEPERPPTSEVSYRSREGTDRRLLLTPPPDAVLQRSGVGDEALSSSRDRRRGSFGRRLSGLVMLPVALSWGLSATFIYLLLPEVQRAVLWVPLVAATAIAALSGALVATLATGRITADVSQLRDEAERIAMGDLSGPVGLRRSDELGDVAGSVERLRVSLQEALERLRKRR